MNDAARIGLECVPFNAELPSAAPAQPRAVRLDPHRLSDGAADEEHATLPPGGVLDDPKNLDWVSPTKFCTYRKIWPWGWDELIPSLYDASWFCVGDRS